MNIVMIVPTGLGADIGGHAGDANPAAKLLAACCDVLITHPNVVNASDINEMTENTWYVEGSMLDRFLAGEFRLKRPTQNRILLVVNDPIETTTINSVSAARVTIGADITIMRLKTPLRMIAEKAKDGMATGSVMGVQELIHQVREYGLHNFDALAIQSIITVDRDVAMDYMTVGGVNPWGGVEAIASKMIAAGLQFKPVAHAPLDCGMFKDFEQVVDPRLSAETVSVSCLHCVLKGLNTAPRPSDSGLAIEDIGALVSPVGCVGPAHSACMLRKIPVIYVNENTTCQNFELPGSIHVENYWEAAGYIMAIKAGIDPRSVRRPIGRTEVLTPFGTHDADGS